MMALEARHPVINHERKTFQQNILITVTSQSTAGRCERTETKPTIEIRIIYRFIMKMTQSY